MAVLLDEDLANKALALSGLGCERLADQVVSLGAQRALTVSTAESCTAGLVAAYLGGVSGASEVLRGGAVTYVDEVKHQVLGVTEQTLALHTAVSSETAEELARGSRALFASDVAVSVTGYAGPTGGTEADPVGTVYFGLAAGDGARTVRHVFEGSRNEVRTRAAAFALALLRIALKEPGQDA